MGIEGKVALITGGARGIGRAIVLRFAQERAKVVFCDILKEESEAVIAEAQKRGGSCTFIKADITSKEEVAKIAKCIEESYGSVDILVNNVGWWRRKLFVDTDEEDWQKIISINLVAPLRVTRALLESMISRGSGSIINIASDAGRIGNGGETVYSACKAAVIGATKALARELVRYNIRVNCVSPGMVDTSLQDEWRTANPTQFEAIMKAVPMRRLGHPEEVASAVLFLASDEASYITGQTLSANGGVTMI